MNDKISVFEEMQNFDSKQESDQRSCPVLKKKTIKVRTKLMCNE